MVLCLVSSCMGYESAELLKMNGQSHMCSPDIWGLCRGYMGIIQGLYGEYIGDMWGYIGIYSSLVLGNVSSVLEPAIASKLWGGNLACQLMHWGHAYPKP